MIESDFNTRQLVDKLNALEQGVLIVLLSEYRKYLQSEPIEITEEEIIVLQQEYEESWGNRVTDSWMRDYKNEDFIAGAKAILSKLKGESNL